MKRSTLALALLMMASSGCSLLKALVKNRYANKLEELEARGDYEGLAEICADPGHESACKAKRRVGLLRLEQAGCDTLEEDIERYYINHSGTQQGDHALVEKFVACGKAESLFAKSFRLRWLPEALTEADKGGAELFSPYLAYLDQGDALYAGQYGGDFAHRFTKWLVAAKDASRCEALEQRVDHVAPESRGEFMWVYLELGCEKEALARSQEFLVSERASDRRQGCEALGKYGDATALDKLLTLAQTDPYASRREVGTASGTIAIETTYPVREACLAAAGQLRIRL
ncbi:MAG: hypothetical protein AAF721_06880 [Myxococcota bacterium]